VAECLAIRCRVAEKCPQIIALAPLTDSLVSIHKFKPLQMGNSTLSVLGRVEIHKPHQAPGPMRMNSGILEAIARAKGASKHFNRQARWKLCNANLFRWLVFHESSNHAESSKTSSVPGSLIIACGFAILYPIYQVQNEGQIPAFCARPFWRIGFGNSVA